MAQWRDFLGRFRPAGAPGAASPRGVPTDRAAAAAAELEPLFALLDEINAEVDRVHRDATDEVAELRARGGDEAEHILTRAGTDSAAVSATAAESVRAAAGTSESELDARHRADLGALRTRIGNRMPDYLDRVVTQARAVLTTGPRA